VVRKGDPTQQEKLGGAADRLAAELGRHIGEHDVRVTVLGHVQRGGTPSAFDRLLGTRYGVAAVDLVAQGKLGHVVALRGDRVQSVPILDACGKLKLVDPEGEIVRVARGTGVELGS
jgi:6-phosphofructokinase 1